MAQRSPAALTLKRIRERTNLSVADVAEYLETAKSSYAYYEDEYKKPFLPLNLVKKLTTLFSRHDIPEDELLALAGVRSGSDTVPVLPINREKATQDAMTNIVELDVRVAAGAGSINDVEEEIAHWQLPRRLVEYATTASSDRIKIVTVIGDSMEPTFRPLEKVMVDTTNVTPSPPGVFVVWDGLGLVVKRVEHVPFSDPPEVVITSDNDRYQPYRRVLEEAHIQGRVLGKWLWV